MLVGQGGQTGVEVDDSSANRIGGPTHGEGNLISGGEVGVTLDGDLNTVQGNTSARPPPAMPRSRTRTEASR